MKRGWIITSIIIGIIILAILLILLFYHRPSVFERRYDTSKEQPIKFITYWIANLEECQGHSKYPSYVEQSGADYSAECFQTTDISNASLNKLKILEGIKGILICNNSVPCSYNFTNCEFLWEFKYQSVVVDIEYRFINIWQCEDRFYLVYGSPPGPPRDGIYRINPSEELISQLQS